MRTIAYVYYYNQQSKYQISTSISSHYSISVQKKKALSLSGRVPQKSLTQAGQNFH